MSAWNIEFDSYLAEDALRSLEKREYDKIFENVVFYLNRLIDALNEVCDEIDWLICRLEQEAEHCRNLQQNYNDNPMMYSDDEAAAINRRSPSKMTSCINKLIDEKGKLTSFIKHLNLIIYDRLQRARDHVDDEAKKIKEMIERGVEIMQKYSSVRF